MLTTLFRSFFPWIIFFIFLGYDEIEYQLGAIGALITLLLLARKGLRRWFLFDWASLLFFVFICASIYSFFHPTIYTNADIIASIILSVLAWSSLIVRKPFTMEYAKQSVAKEYWQTKVFHQINTHLSFIWAICFSLMTLLNILQRVGIGTRQWMDEIIPLFLLLVTIWISIWYPEKKRQGKNNQLGLVSLAGLSDLHLSECMSTTMSYRSIGHGATMLLLPHANMSMYGWDSSFVEALAKRYQVILLDYPGVGASKSKVGEMSNVQSLARVVNEFITEMGLRSVVLVGFGLGGWIAQRIAIDYAKNIHGIVLIGSDAGGSRASVPPKEKLQLLNDIDISPEQQAEHLLEFWFPAATRPTMHAKMLNLCYSADMLRELSQETLDNQRLIAQHWYTNTGSYNDLSQLKQRTLIITGILDILVHRQNSLVLSNGIPHSKLIEYADSGHGVIYQHPTEVASSMISFFKEND